MFENSLIISIIILAAGFVLLGGLFILIRKFNRYMKRSLHVKTIDYMIAFLVSILIFQKTLIAFIRFFTEWFDYLADVISNFSSYQSGDYDRIPNFVSNYIASNNFLNFLFLMIIFFIVSYVISLIRIKFEPDEDGQPLNEVQIEKKDIFLKNTFTSIIVIGSIYLCLSTLIAVSIFDFGQQENRDVETELLEALQRNDLADKKMKEDMLTSIKISAKGILSDTCLTDRVGFVGYYKSVENNINSAFNELSEEQAVAVDQMNLVNAKSLRLDYKLKKKNEIVNWYSNYRKTVLTIITIDYNNYQESVQAFSIKDSQRKENTAFYPVLSRVSNFRNYERQYITQTKEFDVFDFLAGWLIRKLSYNLIIIAGLVGFGFLGAAVSTVIREYKSDGRKELLLGDLLGVIIRGFTAALIVFLAVSGGLSILVKSVGDLNAYALFFTCFGAAVYSENAWEWAKNRLLQNLETIKKKDHSYLLEGRKENLTKVEAFERIDKKLSEQYEQFETQKAETIFNVIDEKLGLNPSSS